MSNHYHLVLRVDAQRVRGWSREEVLRRWTQLFDGPLLVRRFLSEQGEGLDQASLNVIDEWVEVYRARLCDLSWFMRVLNETIARQANAEDNVTGRFWEGRFKSQALLDEQAILTAMAYVDLNPIRAGMAETPEDSTHTSVAERMASLKPERKTKRAFEAERRPAVKVAQPAGATPILPLRHEAHLAQLPLQPLMPFDGTSSLSAAIPFAFEDYLELVEATGRCLHPGKRGMIAGQVPRLLRRLEIDPECFIDCAANLLREFGSAVGAPAMLTDLCVHRQMKYLRGMHAAHAAFGRTGAELAIRHVN